ncbi:winged helix DNA-binding domain-containing protein [Kibdelosporangium persicum]|uniref:winged helix DNA-binding domain-containing protein n=1 Tax=Kibdelosporangium persicum TaxID=2698649 RepID=UPI00156766A3|nr:winged helix DNA-binding domain-containing protein [Kibdelosporangium persicum]
MSEKLSWRQALAWRMRRHHLVEPARDAVTVASTLCGLHAQVMSSAELSLWARTDTLPRNALADALWERRTLVKLWAARGTLHILPSSELGLWLAALGTQTKFGNVGNAKIDKLVDVISAALDDKVLTRTELASAAERISGDPAHAEWIGSSWGSYLKAASFRGKICFAKGDGTQVRFAAPDTWLREPIRRPPAQDALREITRKFLAAYAPATPEDLTRWWLGPPVPTRGHKLIAALGKDAVEVDVEGHRAWVLASDLADIRAAAAPGTACLLPAFDPWVIGMSRRPPLLDPRHRDEVFRKQGWISPVLVVNGRIAGVWRHEGTGDRVSVELRPFGRLPAWAGRRLRARAEQVRDFLAGAQDRL